jgi:eukaryotic-like serine/threonine-protein kinase
VAEEQRRLAEESYAQARAAVDFFTKIAKDEMGDPRLADVRRQMLETALGYYRGFLQQHRDKPEIENELTQAQTQVQLILSELSAFSEFGRVSERARLLEQDTIQNELDLPEKRAEEMTDFMRQFWAWGGKFEPWRMSPAERKDWFEESARATEAKLEQVLTPDQGARLRQIWLQARGPAAFADPDIAEILHLTTAQKEAARKAQDDYRAARIRQWLEKEKDKDKEKGDDKNGREEKPVPPWEADRVLRDQSVQSVVSQLTPAQASTWKQLIGEPFTGPVFLSGQGPKGPGGPGGSGDRGGRDRGRGGRDRGPGRY